MDWQNEKSHWPHADYSCFHDAAGLRWHVQDFGSGPSVLLVHGTGASTHSFAELGELLAQHFHVVMVDLPGHGFSASGNNYQASLNGMSSGLSALMSKLGIDPVITVGHSAGVAVLVNMCLDGQSQPRAIVSFNGALLPFEGFAGSIFSQVAKLFANVPLVSRVISKRAIDSRGVDRLIAQTGSDVPEQSRQCYRALMRSEKHINAALKMMANWKLEKLVQRLPNLEPQLHLIACENDKTIPVHQAKKVQALHPGAELQILPNLGHLSHEEAPMLHYELLTRIANSLESELIDSCQSTEPTSAESHD